jgi:hypothetical protein
VDAVARLLKKPKAEPDSELVKSLYSLSVLEDVDAEGLGTSTSLDVRSITFFFLNGHIKKIGG